MASRNKGFDPLSSLFEAPEPQRGLPLPEVDDDDEAVSAEGAAVGLTDPIQGRQAAALPAETDEAPLPDDDPEDKEALARKLAAEALARARAGVAQAAEPASPGPDSSGPGSSGPAAAAPEDKAALARKLAAEALAKAQAGAAQAAEPAAAQPAAESAEDKVALARRLAEQARAKAAAAAPPPPPGKATPSKKQAATSEAPAKARRGPPAAERKKKARSRVDALAARARKPKSALEAAREAAKQEEERQVEARIRKENELRDVVQDLIPAWLPGIGTVYVANAIAVKDRDVLQALWKAHRTKFLADGQLERAVGAAAVLAALHNSSDGHLVAAHAVTDASDYLVWLDLDKNSLVAAFPDARAYFANPS